MDKESKNSGDLCNTSCLKSELSTIWGFKKKIKSIRQIYSTGDGING
jgi:hypothetical protein